MAGAAVARCWGDALAAHGSVRARTEGPPEMEAEVVLAPAHRLRTEASDGRVVVVVDGAAHSRVDGHWVTGVLNSEDEEEALIAATGEFATVSFSPEKLRRGISECVTWTVAPKREDVELADGSRVPGLLRLDCAAGFEQLGATVTAATLWVGEDWTPIRHEETITLSGVSAPSTTELSDHGAAFDIPVPPR